MFLAIDVGNSQVALGLGDTSSWTNRWRIETDRHRTTDEYSVLIADLLEQDGVDPSVVQAAVATCVVPSLIPVLGSAMRQLFGLEPLMVGPGVRTGMRIKYEPPASLGSDRLVDALAAREGWGSPVVVIDFGTATTFNVVNAEGDFVGGAIAPGAGVAADALAKAGAQLRHIDLWADAGPSIVGRSTEASMQSGVLYGYADLVAGLLGRFQRELGVVSESDLPVVATGGLARRFAPLVPRITVLAPDLTLDGLRIVALLNGVEL